MKLVLPDGRTWARTRWVLGHWILAQLWLDFANDLHPNHRFTTRVVT